MRTARVTARWSADRPVQQFACCPGVDDALHRHAALDRALAPVALPVQLAGRVRVGVDRELAAELDGEGEEGLRWGEPLGAGVDLHGRAVLDAGGEDGLGVELALRPGLLGAVALPAADDEPA